MQSQPVFGRRTLDSVSHIPGTDQATGPASASLSVSGGEGQGEEASTNLHGSASSEPLLTLPGVGTGRGDFSKLAPEGPIEMAPGDDVTRGKDISMDFDLPELDTTTADMPALAYADFPEPARPPILKELNTMIEELRAVPQPGTNQPVVVSLEDDWRTEGQWLGRHGRFWSVLCANWAPADDVWGAGWGVRYFTVIGPNHPPDLLRYWVQWLKTSDNRCLEMSPTYLHSRVLKKLTTWAEDRRESEWDDHGEEYPMIMNGPHLRCAIDVPAGLFYLSLYDVNPNGHTFQNRFRDYTVSIRPHPGHASLDVYKDGCIIIGSWVDVGGFDEKPELAGARIREFWGGVYKQFLVRGPVKLMFEINRNYSFNTILAGVMLDLVDELPPPYFQTRQEWEQRETRRRAVLNAKPPQSARAGVRRGSRLLYIAVPSPDAPA